MLSERRFDTGTVELNYGEGPPNGPPFVILHGGAGSWHYADDLIALLVARWHVYPRTSAGTGCRAACRDATTCATTPRTRPPSSPAWCASRPSSMGTPSAARSRSWWRRRTPTFCGPSSTATLPFRRDDHPTKAEEETSSTSSTWPRTSSGIASPGGRRPRSRAPCGTCRCSCQGSRSRSERGTRSVRTTRGSSFKR